MDGFKPVVKMKTGGSVAKAVEKSRTGKMGGEMHSDVKEDKKVVKKAINMHDDQLHEGAKTDLSKLKKGGRCKKDGGKVRKYNCGGNVKKMADGGLSDMMAASQAAGSANTMPQNAMTAEMLKRKKMAADAMRASAGGGMQGGMMAPPAGGMTGPAPAGPAAAAPAAPAAMPPMKRGGKAKKK